MKTQCGGGFGRLALGTAAACMLGACAAAPVNPDASELDRAWNRTFEASLGGTAGRYTHDIDGSDSDSASYRHGRVIIEVGQPAGFAGGLRASHGKSDTELFEDLGSPAEAIAAEGSLYVLYRWRGGERFRMPVRVGPWIDGLKLSFDNSDSIEWRTYGLQVGFTPEFELVDGRAFGLTAFADVSLSGGQSDIEADVGGNSESFDTTAGAVELELGPRIHWGPCFATLAFHYRRFNAEESDAVGGVRVRGFDGTSSGVALSIGGGF